MSDEDYALEVRKTIVRQLGTMNILSISGGRVKGIDLGVELPVSNGYSVRVVYDEGMDLYDVARVFRRGGKEWVKGEHKGVYCDELGEVAYRAGMFRSYSEEEW